MTSRPLLEGDIRPFLDDEAPALVRRYFSPEFTASRFLDIADGGDARHRHTFTVGDLFAVTMLDVMVPGHAALAILESQSDALSRLLVEVPDKVDLAEATDDQIGPTSRAAEAWSLLEALPGVGWVTASKLLARKRPRLLPVYDSVVKAALNPTQKSFWVPLRNEMQDSALRDRLEEIRDTAGVASSMPVLRVLDACIWMRNRGKSTMKLPFTPRSDA